MYFWIIWENKWLFYEEIKFSWIEIIKLEWNIVLFETSNFDKISNFWTFIKIWEIIKIDLIWEISKDKKIFWINYDKFWIEIKKTYWIRRYKIIELQKTDLEIKNNWIELIYDNIFWEWNIWIVKIYQNIKLFENIDFEKPYNSMNIWMSPSKLAKIMINIWKNYTNKYLWNQNTTIYDPFVWLWTFWFIANEDNLDFVGSDINPTTCKLNLWWWKKTNFFKNKKITIFKQDATLEIKRSFIRNIKTIVSEWYLWPIVKNTTYISQYPNITANIVQLYTKFFENIYSNIDSFIIVIIIPYYFRYKNFEYIDKILDFAKKLWYELFDTKMLYHRKWQIVWRKICVLKKW